MNETSQQKTLQIKKIFWGWEDDKEEAWLREQAKQGRHLVKVEWGLYTFAIGAPRDVVYRLDYITDTDFNKIHEYEQLFTDAGWEPVGKLSGWRYFRKPYQPGVQDEIYSDPESKITKYKRLLMLLLGVMPVMFISLFNFRLFNWEQPVSAAVGWVLVVIIVVLVMVELYFVLRLWLRIRELRRL